MEDANDRQDFYEKNGTTDILKVLEEDKKQNWMGFRYCRKHDLGYCKEHQFECFGEKSCEDNFIAHPKVAFCCICSGLIKRKDNET